MSDNVIEEAKKAVERVNTAFEEFKATNEENLKSRDTLLEEKLTRIDRAIEAAQAVADEAALAAKRSARVVTDANGEVVDLDAKAAKWAKSAARRRHEQAPQFDGEKMAEYNRVFDRYMRVEKGMLDHDEIKALSVGSDPDGGYLVNPDMNGRIVQRIFDTSPIRAYASVQVIGTDALEGLYDDDESTYGWVGETASRPETNTPEIGKWRIPVHEIYSKPKATQKLLDDAEINMEMWLENKVRRDFMRAENTAFCTGAGVSTPRGFLTYNDWSVAGTYQRGAIEQFDTGVSGGFAAVPAGADVLINALYALKPEYMAAASWFMNQSTVAAVRKLKNSDGAYHWQPSIAVGQPSTLFGHGVAMFNDMPAIAAGSLSIAVGDMAEAYQIVDRMGIRVLRDPYSAKPYVEFYTTKRVGGDVVNFDALKLVKFTN